MNVTDDKTKVTELMQHIEGADMLRTIFKYQHNLSERYKGIERQNDIYYPDNISIDACKDQEFLKRLGYRCIAEMHEALECLKNKAWKQTNVPTDLEHLKEELADALHFFIELCLALGMDAEDLFIYYLKKNNVNDWRIKTNY